MIQITKGKKRTASFIPVDQFGNPNPVGADGQPLDVVGVPVWDALAIDPRIFPGAPSAVTLVPSEDGRLCDVIAVEENGALTVEVTAQTAEGTSVKGSSAVQTVGAAGPVSVIASLGISWSEEQDA
jgi:hypothetical protein